MRRLPPSTCCGTWLKTTHKGAENDEITENNILDDNQSDEISNQVVEQMTREEADADQLTPQSYGCAKRKEKKNHLPMRSISMGIQRTDKHYQSQYLMP